MSADSTKDDEESLFLAEMSGVTPLKPDNKIRAKIRLKKNLQTSSDDGQDFSSEGYAIDDVFSTAAFSTSRLTEDCPDVLNFSRSGLQHKVLKKLRQGKFPIEHALDLHGLTVEQARRELLTFLGECEIAGVRHAIIVHGKGFRSRDKPVIKPMVNRWLSTAENVLAFHSALPKDGGSGAVYVLLKK
jgi:DNA-nicking Smr family endonuclease